MQDGGYAFSLTPKMIYEDIVSGIGIAADTVSIRSDDGTWIVQNLAVGKDFEIKYEGGEINVYTNSVVKFSHPSQHPITILAVGSGNMNNSISSTYWKGEINNLVYNGKELMTSGGYIGESCDVYRTNFYLTDQQAEKLNAPIHQTKEEIAKLWIEKTAEKIILYKKNNTDDNTFVAIDINKRKKGYEAGIYPSYYDSWGINIPYECIYTGNKFVKCNELFRISEAELAISVPRGDKPEVYEYVGGSMHGFEMIKNIDGLRAFSINVDGKNIAEIDIITLKPIRNFYMYQQSEYFQSCTNTNPFGVATKEWIFDSEGLRIKCSFKVTRNILIKYSQFGMFGVYRHQEGSPNKPYLTSKAIKDYQPYKVYNIEDDWHNVADNNQLQIPDNKCHKISLWGETPYTFSLEARDTDFSKDGGLFISNNGSNYNKIYVAVAYNYSAKTGDNLSATQVWGINKNN